MDKIELTTEEIERYRPYHTYYEFMTGFNHYMAGRFDENLYIDVAAQAYDRGAECAMRREQSASLERRQREWDREHGWGS